MGWTVSSTGVFSYAYLLLLFTSKLHASILGDGLEELLGHFLYSPSPMWPCWLNLFSPAFQYYLDEWPSLAR